MIDLGTKYDSSCCSPCSPPSENKISYPTLYFTCGEEIEFPDEGTATIKFRKVECSENMRDPKDPKYRYELEVQGIDIKGMKTEPEGYDGEDMTKKAIKGMDMVMIKKKENY